MVVLLPVLLSCLAVLRGADAGPARRCDSADEEQNVRAAYALAKGRRFEEALPCFQRAAAHFPYVPRVLTDAGRAAMRVARRALASDGGLEGVCNAASPTLEDLRDACAALLLAGLLGDANAEKPRARCEEHLANASCGGGGLAADAQGRADRWAAAVAGVATLQRLRAARTAAGSAPRTADTIAAAQALCPDGGGGASVDVSSGEAQSGRLRPLTLLLAFLHLEVCGLVELTGPVVPVDLLAHAASAQSAGLADARSGTAGKGPDGRVAVERWQKRFEVKVPLAPPFTDPRLAGNPLLLHLVRLMLGPRVEIDTFSHVTSLPGAPAQPWHADVDLLFKDPDALVWGNGHLPAAGLVVVAPLANLTVASGPTEFNAGTHQSVQGAWEQWEALGTWEFPPAGPAPPRLRPLPSLGSAVVFDLRTRHRGAANVGEVPRAILYMSFVKDWFLDRLNFRGHQSAGFHSLGAPLVQKLLRRVDARSYLEGLEAHARGGADPPRPAGPFNEAELHI